MFGHDKPARHGTTTRAHRRRLRRRRLRDTTEAQGQSARSRARLTAFARSRRDTFGSALSGAIDLDAVAVARHRVAIAQLTEDSRPRHPTERRARRLRPRPDPAPRQRSPRPAAPPATATVVPGRANTTTVQRFIGLATAASRARAGRRHRPATPAVSSNSGSNSAPVTRLANSKRISSSTRQPSSPSGVSVHRPSSTRNGPLTSCISTRRSGSSRLRVVNSACSGPRLMLSVATTSPALRASRAQPCTRARIPGNARCR